MSTIALSRPPCRVPPIAPEPLAGRRARARRGGWVLWNLTINGYSNEYYAAAARAGSESWKAWFFGALDPRLGSSPSTSRRCRCG